MNKLCKMIDKNILKIFIVFLYLQPILDVLAGISIYKYNDSFTISSVIRFLFLAFSVIYIIVKKYKLKYLMIIFLYAALFSIGILMYKSNYMYEIKYLLYALYMPIMLIFSLLVISKNNFNKKHLYYILLIYSLLIFIPNILDIGFDSYWHSKTGSVGFFYSANAVGNTISLLLPLLIAYLLNEKKYIHLLVFLIIYIYVMLTMGTKSPLLFFIIIVIYYNIAALIKLIKQKKYSILFGLLLTFIIFIIVLIIYLPDTPFYKNLVIHLNYLNVHSIKDLFTLKNIDHFVFSSRFSFFGDSFEIYKNSSLYQKLFGIGYTLGDNEIKLVEMDYLDTFLHHGIIGFSIIYYLYIKVVIEIFRDYNKKIKVNFFDSKKTSIILATVISIIGALFIGHVLLTPTVVIFVIVILSLGYNKVS